MGRCTSWRASEWLPLQISQVHQGWHPETGAQGNCVHELTVAKGFSVISPARRHTYSWFKRCLYTIHENLNDKNYIADVPSGHFTKIDTPENFPLYGMWAAFCKKVYSRNAVLLTNLQTFSPMNVCYCSIGKVAMSVTIATDNAHKPFGLQFLARTWGHLSNFCCVGHGYGWGLKETPRLIV